MLLNMLTFCQKKNRQHLAKEKKTLKHKNQKKKKEESKLYDIRNYVSRFKKA